MCPTQHFGNSMYGSLNNDIKGTCSYRGEPGGIRQGTHGFPRKSWVLERLAGNWGTTTHRDLLEYLHSDIVDLRGTVDPVYCGPIPYSREIAPNVRESFWGWRQETTMAACGPEEIYVDFPLAGGRQCSSIGSTSLAESGLVRFQRFRPAARAVEGFCSYGLPESAFGSIRHFCEAWTT